MSQQSPSKGTHTPMGRAEFESHADHGWSPGTLRQWAQRAGLAFDAPAGDLYDALAARSPDGEHGERAMRLLAHVAHLGGRVRGENLRKDLLFRGLGDQRALIAALAEEVWLVTVPASGELSLDAEGALEHDRFLQHDLALLEPVLEGLSARELGSERLGAEREVADERLSSADALELDLLLLCAELTRAGMRLNKSGAPNRRSLARAADGLLNATGEAASTDRDADLDYLALVMALGQELGLLHTRTDADEVEVLEADHAAAKAFFARGNQARGESLFGALSKLKGWSEVVSGLTGAEASAEALDTQLSRTATNGADLLGARGYVLSVLRRATLTGWVDLEAIVELGTNLDRDYLPRALERAGVDTTPADYIRAMVTRALFMMGMVDLGTAADGEELVRLTARGHQLLGEADFIEIDPRAKCLITQPNLETMVFLDGAPMRALFVMSELADSVRLADRVATFALTPASVQRGYSLGHDADEVVAFLTTHGHTPPDATLTFQLKDWERQWGRLAIYADGWLLRHEDPDQLDVALDSLRHRLGGKPEVVRLTAGAAYVSASTDADVSRFLRTHSALLIDYTGTRPPCLEFVEPMVLAYKPMEADFITIETFDAISRPAPGSTAWSRKRELDLGAAGTRWPEDPLGGLTAFLEEAVVGGLPPARALQLRAALGAPERAARYDEVVALDFDTAEAAELFCAVDRGAELVIARIGPTSVLVDASQADELDDLLDELGVVT